MIETVSADGRTASEIRRSPHLVAVTWKYKNLSKVQSSDVSCMMTSQLDFSLWFNCGYWRENTSMNIVRYMIMARRSKQHRMVT